MLLILNITEKTTVPSTGMERTKCSRLPPASATHPHVSVVCGCALPPKSEVKRTKKRRSAQQHCWKVRRNLESGIKKRLVPSTAHGRNTAEQTRLALAHYSHLTPPQERDFLHGNLTRRPTQLVRASKLNVDFSCA